MGNMKEKYLIEFEKYKHVVIEPGSYRLRGAPFHYQVLSVDEANNMVEIESDKGARTKKTLHWARKNLVKD